MPRNQRKSFITALGRNYSSIDRAFGNISTIESQAGKSEDQQRILELVKLTVGFETVDSLVYRLLRKWMLRVVEKELLRLEERLTTGSIANDLRMERILFLELKICSSRLFAALGMTTKAFEGLREAVTACEEFKSQLLRGNPAQGITSEDKLSLKESLKTIDSYLVNAKSDFADLLANTGAPSTWKQAEEIYKDCLSQRMKLYGNLHPETLSTSKNYASLLLKMGDHSRRGQTDRDVSREAVMMYATAKKVLSDGITACRKSIRELSTDLNFLHLQLTLGQYYIQVEEFVQAEKELTDCLKSATSFMKASDPDVLLLQISLAILRSKQWEYSCLHCIHLDNCHLLLDSVQRFEQVFDVYKVHYGWLHPKTIETLNNFVIVLSKFPDPSWAREKIESLLVNTLLHPHSSKVFDEKTVEEIDHLSTIPLLKSVSVFFERQKEYSRCISYYEQIVELLEKSIFFGPFHPDTLKALVFLGDLYDLNDQELNAEQCYWQANERRQRSQDDQNGEAIPLTEVNRIRKKLAIIYERKEELEQLDKAEVIFREIYENNLLVVTESSTQRRRSVAEEVSPSLLLSTFFDLTYHYHSRCQVSNQSSEYYKKYLTLACDSYRRGIIDCQKFGLTKLLQTFEEHFNLLKADLCQTQQTVIR